MSTTAPETSVRITSTPDAGVARTRKANATNRARGAATAAREIAGRLEYLDDERLAALAAVLVAEALARGLAVPDLR